MNKNTKDRLSIILLHLLIYWLLNLLRSSAKTLKLNFLMKSLMTVDEAKEKSYIRKMRSNWRLYACFLSRVKREVLYACM